MRAKFGSYPPKNRRKNRMILALKSAKNPVISADTPPKRGKNGCFLGKNGGGFTGFRSIPPQHHFRCSKTTENDRIPEHIPPILCI